MMMSSSSQVTLRSWKTTVKGACFQREVRSLACGIPRRAEPELEIPNGLEAGAGNAHAGPELQIQPFIPDLLSPDLLRLRLEKIVSVIRKGAVSVPE